MASDAAELDSRFLFFFLVVQEDEDEDDGEAFI